MPGTYIQNLIIQREAAKKLAEKKITNKGYPKPKSSTSAPKKKK